MKLPASGSCQCGNVNYEITDEPLVTYACHCRDCQKLSTSAFSIWTQWPLLAVSRRSTKAISTCLSGRFREKRSFVPETRGPDANA